MIPDIRKKFNDEFTLEKYEAFKEGVAAKYGLKPSFREAESPFFISKVLKNRLFEACQLISDVIKQPDIKQKTQGALYDDSLIVPNEDAHTTFLQMDFGITLDDGGDPVPMLIEVQGFPSVYFFQYMVSELYKKHYDIPDYYTSYFNGYTPETYKNLLYDVIVGDCDPREVVLLEIEPEKQNTYIDMLSTSIELGIPVVCITAVIKEGRQLFYADKEGQKVQIKRIYNRVIFDELYQRTDLTIGFHFSDDLDVKWVGHPNWFYRISKYLMPHLKNRYVPETIFLHDLKEIPADLENYVLKPLFSFSGSGVIIDVTTEDIDNITDKSNFILQKKVHYAPVRKSPHEPVKVEIRMLMIWPDEAPEPQIINNLVRLSKGKMIGVKYNKDRDWVGGSVGFYDERDD